MKKNGTDENCAVILTGPGAAAIAVVRIAGPLVGDFLRKHFSRAVAMGRCVHGILRDGDEVIDDPVIVLVDEQTADINLHGGTWVVSAVLELASREGFEIDRSMAVSAMFSEYANHGRDAHATEMLAALPMARTREAIAILLAQPAAWEKIDPREAGKILADKSLWWLLHPPRVAIVGEPNVGKSTLANQLFGTKRSIVANVAGTTRDWVGEYANIDGLAVMLVDTPGIRETTDAIEAAAIGMSREQVEGADLVVRVVNARSSNIEERSGEILVLNKSDLATPQAAGKVIRTMATTGQGVDELRAEILRYFGCEDLNPHRPRWWTDRQREVLQRMMS